MAEIKLENITKVFKVQRRRRTESVVAVDGMNLKIEDGEFLVLLGPSGCGKTTTLRIIAGLETPTEGRVFIGGKDVTEYPARERGIAMVFQDYALYPHMSVFENMSFALKNLKFPKDEIKKRVTETARMLGIENLLDRMPKELSGGQRQRVALGRAIVRKPQAYLFDEPLSNLDARLRIQMRAELKELHMKLGTTAVYVTHDQIEAMTLGDRIVVMRNGKIQQVGKPEEIYHRPANLFVANFIGTPPMCFFRVKVVDENGIKFLFKNGDTMTAPSKFWEKLSKYLEDEIIVGVRPEDIKPVDRNDGALNVFISSSEFVGTKILVNFKIGEERGIMEVEPEKANLIMVGKSLPITFNMEKLHLFDPETQKNIGVD